MERPPFREEEVAVLRHAIEISEELISDHYKISTSQWKRYRYDVQSLKDLEEDEITDAAFAQIRRYARGPTERLRGSELGDYFKICLQDHMILQALERDPQIMLLPLTTYIVTHELIHVVRFASFLQRFQVSEGERETEEKLVHGLTYQLLAPRKLKGLYEVLHAFRDFGMMETLVVTV
jgi:hypothetical protein